MRIISDLYTTSNALNQAMQAYILGAYFAIISTINNYILGREITLYSGGRFAGVGNAVELALILTLVCWGRVNVLNIGWNHCNSW
jgi:hypothetical protein